MDLIYTTFVEPTKDVKRWLSSRPALSPAFSAVSPHNVLLFSSSVPDLAKYCTASSSSANARSGSSSSSASDGDASFSADDPPSAGYSAHAVYVVDLNTPWEPHCVTVRHAPLTCLAFNEYGNAFVVADADGTVEWWRQQNFVLSDWKLLYRERHRGETVLKAKFINWKKKTFLNNEKMDSPLYNEKFVSQIGPRDTPEQLGTSPEKGCVLVTASSLLITLIVSDEAEIDADPGGEGGDAGDADAGAGREGVVVETTCLGGRREHIRLADITFLHNGQLTVATSNGDPTYAVRFFAVKIEYELSIELTVSVSDFPAIFLQTQTKTATGSGASTSSSSTPGDNPSGAAAAPSSSSSSSAAAKPLPSGPDDECLAIVNIGFVKGDDCDAVLLATEHPSGGRLELWELKEFSMTTHKMFNSEEMAISAPKIICPAWHYVEVFSGPTSAQVCSLASPQSSLQNGPDSPCYVAVAYDDGSVQCLLKDSLQQIGSVDLPKSGHLLDSSSGVGVGGPPPSKAARLAAAAAAAAVPSSSSSSAQISSMAFTATGNGLVVVDSFGQLYVYKMSPISDPGGPHTVPYLVTMFEFCLVSGYDFWDVTVCAQTSHLPLICDKLQANYAVQPQSYRDFYFPKYMAIRCSLYRLYSGLEYKSADCLALMLLETVKANFRGHIKSTDLQLWPSSAASSAAGGGAAATNEKMLTTPEKIAKLLESRKDETDIDRLVSTLQPVHKDFVLPAPVMQMLQNMIQWTASLVLHIMASLPEYKHRKGPGFDLHTDEKTLGLLRELLVAIRIWGTLREASRPAFATMADIDVLHKLFALLTRLKEAPNDETLLDDCLRLPSQVVIPPLSLQILPRGAQVSVLSSAALCSSSGHSGQKPVEFWFDCESEHEVAGAYGGGQDAYVFVEGAMTNSAQQQIDSIRSVYLGKEPHTAKHCSRCFGMTIHQDTPATPAAQRYADKRFARKCPCGGNWKLRRHVTEP